MNLATAVNIMDHVAANDGEIGFNDDDPTSGWYEAWSFFKRRPTLRKAYEQRRLAAVPHVPRLADVRPFIAELVEVFKILNAWYEEAAR